MWSRDGRELFYRGPRGMMLVPVDIEPTFRAGDPEVLFEDQQYFQVRQSRTYDLASDGRFLMTKGPVAQIVLVQNWHQELLEPAGLPVGRHKAIAARVILG